MADIEDFIGNISRGKGIVICPKKREEQERERQELKELIICDSIWRDRTFSAKNKEGEITTFLKLVDENEKKGFGINQALYSLDIQPAKPNAFFQYDNKYLMKLAHLGSFKPLSKFTKKEITNEKLSELAKFLAKTHIKLYKTFKPGSEHCSRKEELFEKFDHVRTVRERLGLLKPKTDKLQRLSGMIGQIGERLYTGDWSKQFIVHGDGWADNVVYHNGEWNFIDWDQSGIGAPTIDLARFVIELQRFGISQDDFMEKYYQALPEDELGDVAEGCNRFLSSSIAFVGLHRFTSHSILASEEKNESKQKEQMAGALRHIYALKQEDPKLLESIVKNLKKNPDLPKKSGEFMLELMEAVNEKDVKIEETPKSEAVIEVNYSKNTADKLENSNKKVSIFSGVKNRAGKVAAAILAFFGIASCYVSCAGLTLMNPCVTTNTIMNHTAPERSSSAPSLTEEVKSNSIIFKYPEAQLLEYSLNEIVTNAREVVNVNDTFYDKPRTELEREIVTYFADMNIEKEQASKYFKVLEEEKVLEEFYQIKDIIRLELKDTYDLTLHSFMQKGYLEDSNGKEFKAYDEIKQYVDELFGDYLAKKLKDEKQ